MAASKLIERSGPYEVLVRFVPTTGAIQGMHFKPFTWIEKDGQVIPGTASPGPATHVSLAGEAGVPLADVLGELQMAAIKTIEERDAQIAQLRADHDATVKALQADHVAHMQAARAELLDHMEQARALVAGIQAAHVDELAAKALEIANLNNALAAATGQTAAAAAE